MSIIRCSRKDCGGFLIVDDDKRCSCVLCGRAINTPEPLPMTASSQANGHSRVNYRYRTLTPEQIADLEKERRARYAANAREKARERRYRESHFVSKA